MCCVSAELRESREGGGSGSEGGRRGGRERVMGERERERREREKERDRREGRWRGVSWGLTAP